MLKEKFLMTAIRPSHDCGQQALGHRSGKLKQLITLLISVLFFSVSLAAADPEVIDSPDPDATADATDQAAGPDHEANPAEQPEMLSERERMRQQLEEMVEHLEAGEDIDHQALRERFRGRQRQAASRGNWWQNEDLAGNLALSEQQKDRLDQLHEDAATDQRQAAAQQRELQQALNAALSDANFERVKQLMDDRADNAAALQRAEDQWLGGVLEVLSTDQLQTLQSEYPRALRSRATRGRMYRER